jgi:hypothetical protein
MVADILQCVESPTDPLLEPLHLPDADPLLHYEAPDEVEAEVDLIVHRLIALILAGDVVAFVPILTDVHGEEWESVLNRLISAPVLHSDARDYANSTLTVDRIIHISGPVPDRPILVTADDVVGRILRQELLPELPVRRREIEELIDDELDDIDLEQPEFDDEEEDLPEEIVRMITYRPKRAIRSGD